MQRIFIVTAERADSEPIKRTVTFVGSEANSLAATACIQRVKSRIAMRGGDPEAYEYATMLVWPNTDEIVRGSQ